MIARPALAIARRAWRGVVIVLSCLGVAVAAWLVPASVEIVAWPTTGPARVALFASAARLWLALAIGLAAAVVLYYLGPRQAAGDGGRAGIGTGDGGRAATGDGGDGRSLRARWLAPLSLTWLWTVPYWPWLPDRAPVLLILAGPIRWVIAAVAIAGAFGVWVQSRGWPLAFPRPRRAGIFVTTLGLYVCMGLWSLQTVGLSGDEPQYLIISHSLLVDRDLKIENNHRAGDYRAFFKGELPPDYLRRGQNREIYSVHAPGLPVLLLPAYAIGGMRGAIILMCLLGALAALAVFDVATLLGGTRIGLVTWMSVCLTVPWVPFSWSLFPEMAAALIVAWAVRWLVEGPAEAGPHVRMVDDRQKSYVGFGASRSGTSDDGPHSSRSGESYVGSGFSRTHDGPPEGGHYVRWLLRGACLAALPWLHTKFVVLLAALTAFLLLQLRNRLWNAAAFLLPIVLSSIAWIGFFYVVYGTADPTAPYGAAYMAQLVRFDNLPRSVLGLLFDQKFGLLVYSPVYFVAGVGAWLLLRDRVWRSLTVAMLLTTLLYVASSGRYYMWWGGSSAPARFLVPVLPLFAPMVAAALWRIRSDAGRAAAAALAAFSLIVAAVGVFRPERLLLYSEPHGIARFLEVIQGSAPLSLALPTFTEADWLAAVPRGVPWVLAAGLAFCLVLLATRWTNRSSLFWIGAVEAIAFVFIGGLLSGPFPEAARAETVLRGKFGLMEALDPAQLRGFDYATWARLDGEGVLRASSLTIARQGHEGVPEGRIGGLLSLPPGSYTVRVWFAGGPRDGDLLLSLGRGNVIARAAGPLANPATLTFELPVSIHAWVVLSNPQSARAVRTVEITPLALVPRPSRLNLTAVAVEAIEGRPNALLVYADDNTYPEGGVFWTRGTDRGTVFVVPAGAAQIVLTLHIGPNAGLVRLEAAGEHRDTVMAANETQRVVIAAPIGVPVVPVSVQAPGWFRPIDVEPGSTDMRALGCQVRVELE